MKLYEISKEQGGIEGVLVDDCVNNILVVRFNNKNIGVFNRIDGGAYTFDNFGKIVYAQSTFIRWLDPLEIMVGSFKLNNKIINIEKPHITIFSRA